MCQARPGVRCTHHTRARLRSISKRLDKVIAEYDKIKHGRNNSRKDILLERIEHLQKEHAKAERDYYSSPGGIKELEGRLDDASLTDEDREIAALSLELAKYDRSVFQMAHIIHTRYKERVSPGESDALAAARQKEAESAAYLARAMNSANPQIGQVIRAAQNAKRNRIDLEEMLRRKVAGVTKLKEAPLEAAVKSGLPVVLALSSKDFGRASEYFDFGAYGRVTGVVKSEDGNYEVSVEGGVTHRMGPHSRVYVSEQFE